MLERMITAFGNQTHVNNGLDISIRNTFDIIKSDSLKEKIEAIRKATDPTIQSKLKDSLPKVTWNGRFGYRNSNGLIEYSGFTAIDIDLTPEQMDDLYKFKKAYSTDPSVCGIFFTPRFGVKVIYAAVFIDYAGMFALRVFFLLGRSLGILNPLPLGCETHDYQRAPRLF